MFYTNGKMMLVVDQILERLVTTPFIWQVEWFIHIWERRVPAGHSCYRCFEMQETFLLQMKYVIKLNCDRSVSGLPSCRVLKKGLKFVCQNFNCFIASSVEPVWIDEDERDENQNISWHNVEPYYCQHSL